MDFGPPAPFAPQRNSDFGSGENDVVLYGGGCGGGGGGGEVVGKKRGGGGGGGCRGVQIALQWRGQRGIGFFFHPANGVGMWGVLFILSFLVFFFFVVFLVVVFFFFFLF